MGSSNDHRGPDPPGSVANEMSTHPIEPSQGKSLELPVEELLRRARPLPRPEDMVIDDLSAEEGEAFLAALDA
jgi:hypothetical protein